MKHRDFTACFCAALVLGVAPFAYAGDLFINGVNVEGLTSQTFEKVNVRIDEKGNVFIEAPGYSVKRVTMAEPQPPAAPEAVLSRKYFLVTEQSVQGMAEYDVEVFLNGKYLRTLASADPQLVTDVTKYLKPGRNQVTLQAKKHLENPEARKSTARAHVFRVIIGEGAVNAEQVVIEKQLVTFARTAADSNDVTQEFSFTTR